MDIPIKNGSFELPLDEIVAAIMAKITNPRVDVLADPPTGKDDQEKIYAAQDKAKVGVQLYPGIYRCSKRVQIYRDGLALYGVGCGERSDSYLGQASIGTRIEADNDYGDSVLVEVAKPDGFRPLAGVCVKNLSIDGRRQGVNVTGLYWSSHRGEVEGVNISNCTGNGMVMEGVAADPRLTPPRPQWQTYDCRYRGIRSHHNGGHGILFGPHSPDSQCDDLMVFHNGGDGLRVQSASHQIGRVHAYSNENGIHFDNQGTRTKIDNIKAEQNKRSGVYINGATAGIMSIIIGILGLKNNGAAGMGLYDQLCINANPGAVIGTRFGIVEIADTAGEGGIPGLARYGVNLMNQFVRDTTFSSLRIETNAYKVAKVNDLGLRSTIRMP